MKSKTRRAQMIVSSSPGSKSNQSARSLDLARRYKCSCCCRVSTLVFRVPRKSIKFATNMKRPSEHLFAGRDFTQSTTINCILSISMVLLIILTNFTDENQLQANAHQTGQTQPVPEASESDQQSSSSSSSATCFGGLQTFEKISMSSFENPQSGSAGSSGAAAGFAGGILVQQDDQALTSECVNLCRSQSNCLSFVIDYNKFECKSYATTQQELQQELDAKFQFARSTNGSSNNNGSIISTNSTDSNASSYLMSSASSIHFQHLLPSASSNYFEKICLDGVANRNQFGDVCGQNRLWTIERVVDSFLDGYIEKEVTNVNNKDECSKLCIFETQFVCRSADYDQQSRLCRLSKEDRRTQPQAMRYVAGSNRHYLENQCATPGPSSCVYETKKNLAIISMDALKFAQTVQDCQMKCNQESTFNCRSYSFHQQRCFLSGDDSASLNSNLIRLPMKQGWQFGEKKCLIELCTKGMFSYEKITGYTLRSALSSPIDLMMPSSTLNSMMIAMMPAANDLERQETGEDGKFQSLPNYYSYLYNNNQQQQQQARINNTSDLVSAMMMLAANSGQPRQTAADPMQEAAATTMQRRHQRSSGSSNLAITNHCRHSCDLAYLNCPAFTIDYKNNRCQRLDRNSQGRHHELVARDGYSYYEKICLRVPEIMSMCQDKYWIFERVIGHELAPRFYDKSLKFVQSRRDCEEYCLEEKQFQCRSALYNDETSDCKLSRYDRRLANQEGGGYYKNFNSRVSYLENQCVRDHRTIASPSDSGGQNEPGPQKHQQLQVQCYYEQARDEPSYPTFTEHIEMVPMPTISSGQVEAVAGTRLGGDDSRNSTGGSRSPAASSAYCEQLCNDNAKFECHSFGYYSSTAQCFLSGDDTVSAGESASTPSTGFTYYEKHCRFPNGPTNNSTLTGVGEMSSTSSPENLNPYLQPARHKPTAVTGTSSSIFAKPNEGNFQANETSFAQLGNSNQPDLYKCGLGHTFVYQRISGFEPIGGYLTILIKNNDRPGIVMDCAELCKSAYECRAFVVDYNSNQCFAMLENSALGMLSLRQTLGKDYFEGFCVPSHTLISLAPTVQLNQANNCANKTWIMDKIVDQAVVGVQHQKLIQDSDRVSCRMACLEERLFACKSAMFDSISNECKLYSIDRESVPQMRLLFTKGVDFYENQCQIVANSCPYDAIERDMTIVSVTKSIQARSTFDCELACNSEFAFNCRSYTYIDQYPSLPNLCLLSSDSRSTSQKGSVREQHRTLYAERNCYYRRPRYPANQMQQHHAQVSPELDPYRRPQHQSSGHASHLDNNYGPPATTTPIEHLGNGYDNLPKVSSAQTEQPTPPGQAACEPHQFTFERAFGYDYRLGQKERAPIAPTTGIAIGCQQECLRRGDRCQSFVVEYGLPFQNCFLISSQVGANKKLLIKSPNSAYFEKVCLPRMGIEVPMAEHATTHAQLVSSSAAPSSSQAGEFTDIAPSYSSEPWSPQGGAHPASSGHPLPQQVVPYHQGQQQLIQNYPSRSCAKLWSFERFLNHNFTIQSDRVLENVLSRTSCEISCLNEVNFNCRAATYDYANKLCRLFKHTRRTIMSQFVDLNQPEVSEPSGGTISPNSPATSPGTAQVINGEVESIYTAASSNSITNSSSLSNRQAGLRQISPTSSLSTGEPSSPERNIDYLENNCAPEPSSCQYRQLYDLFSPYIDKLTHAVSLSDCQRQCDLERLFVCKSINYDPISRNCMLLNEDLISLNRGQQQQSLLLPKKNTVYSEKGNCEMISVQCNSQEMLVSINFDAPFKGRIMAKGNPESCFMIGDGQTNLQFPIVFGPKCNSRQEGHNTFVNELIIQQHPVIMTDQDKTIRIMCAFEAPDQTITLKTPTSRDGNKTGIDVGAGDASRTRHDKQQFNSVVSNKAPPPSVLLRILDLNNRDASMINLGDDLILKIQMQMDDKSNSALGIFARNLLAKSSNGETLLLIDNDGCPVDSQVFPGLEVDPKDEKSLFSTFKAFRFPSSGLVNFEVQIRFCPERCQPVDCSSSSRSGSFKSKSFGRRRKRQVPATGSEDSPESRMSVFQSVDSSRKEGRPLELLSTVMKPGKAFQYVRELMMIDTKATPVSGEIPEPIKPEPTAGMEETVNSTASRLAEAEEISNQVTTEQASSSTEMNQYFDNSQAAIKLEDNIRRQQQPQAEVQTASSGYNQNNEFLIGDRPNQQPIRTIDSAITGVSSQVSQYQTLREPILMHVDERVVPNVNGNFPHANSVANAPYGRIPIANSIELQQQRRRKQPTISFASTEAPKTDFANNQEQSQTSQAPAVDSPVAPEENQPLSKEEVIEPTSSGGIQSTSGSGKDMPLRFSILVGENQGNAEQENWKPGFSGPAAPTVLIMNSTKVDLDHIVIPGKDGQFNEDGSLIINRSQTSNNTATASANDQNQPPSTDIDEANLNSLGDGKSLIPNPNQNLNDESLIKGIVLKSKQNTLYEQTFDALPSNSVSVAEVKLNSNRIKGQNGPESAGGSQDSSGQESAASYQHDCVQQSSSVLSSGGGRLWTIIWTGTFVITLNVCLVVLSLVLYFKKVHFRANHNIIRTTTSDYGTHSSSGLAGLGGQAASNFGRSKNHGTGSGWPSVLLKSKNNLGTSLNAHEHFFCTLNSKERTTGRASAVAAMASDLQWPNLSSSSSHSTISSMAAGGSKQASTSVVKINQSLYKPPYDSVAQGTSKFGNYPTTLNSNFGIRRGSLFENLNSHNGTELSTTGYTNNLNESQEDDDFDRIR